MRNTEKQELKHKIKRIGLFMLIVFVPTMVISSLLKLLAHVEEWLNILITVVILFILFGIFAYVCDKLDKKKEERLSKKKDPFAD